MANARPSRMGNDTQSEPVKETPKKAPEVKAPEAPATEPRKVGDTFVSAGVKYKVIQITKSGGYVSQVCTD